MSGCENTENVFYCLNIHESYIQKSYDQGSYIQTYYDQGSYIHATTGILQLM